MAHPKPCQLIEYDGAKEIHHGDFPSHKMALLHTRNNDIKSYLIVSPASGKGIASGIGIASSIGYSYAQGEANGYSENTATNHQISMKIQLTKGRTKSTLNKTFIDERHKNNYIALMQRKGFKVEVFSEAEHETKRNHTKEFIEDYENEVLDNTARSIGA